MLIPNPAQAGSSCLCRGIGGVSQVYHFEYDNFGNTTSIGLGGWNATEQITLASYVYAAKNGLLTTQTYGNGDNVSFTYDILGRTKTATYKDKDGDTDRVLTYVYTGDGQLYSIHDSSTGYTYLYTYDNIGRLIASCVKLNTTVLMSTRQEYNANNQLIAQHWTVDGTTYSESYTYSKTDGALTSSTNAVGQTLTYNYDKLRRLSSITGGLYERKYTYKDVSDSNTTPLVSGYYYKDASGTPVYSFGYTYDVLGNIASHTDASGTLTYTYDAQNQLTRVRKSGTTLYEYTYDNAGNILTASNGTTTHTYTYGNTVWKDLLTKYDGQTITYDGSGNPLSYYNGTRWEFEWEEGRNLVSAAAGSNTYEYAYDSNGLRVSKEENGKTHTYLYASGKLLRETISVGNTVTDTLDFFYDHNGYPCELNHTANGTTTTYYYITNLQGDVLAMITGSGTVVASYSYDPYGKVISATKEMADINPLRYRGYYYDAEAGFYYLQSRYYDPAICRFINADGLMSNGQSVQENNMFAYCDNNPAIKVDYSGEDGQTIELGNGWYCRIDAENTSTGTKRHIHIWNNKKKYIQNEDGSPHDKGKGQKGKIPKWLNEKLIDKVGWDYNGKRKSFFEKTTFKCMPEGTEYSFADGTTVFRTSIPYMLADFSVDGFEGVYYLGSTSSSETISSRFFLVLPFFWGLPMPSFSWGVLPIPVPVSA